MEKNKECDKGVWARTIKSIKNFGDVSNHGEDKIFEYVAKHEPNKKYDWTFCKEQKVNGQATFKVHDTNKEDIHRRNFIQADEELGGK